MRDAIHDNEESEHRCSLFLALMIAFQWNSISGIQTRAIGGRPSLGGRIMRVRRSLYSALFIVFGLSLPAAANDLKVCFSSGAHDVIVAACTRAIDSGDARGRDAAIAYNQRGLAYENGSVVYAPLATSNR